MPTKSEIQKEILESKGGAQDAIRRKYLHQLHEYTKRDIIVYASAFTSKKFPNIPPPLISITNEDIQSFMSALHGLKGKDLDLILHSPGGSAEAADQIVQYLRSKYSHIRAIVPQNAMSAATMIACACDEIVMGKHSALGPIDPQVTLPAPQGQFTAAAQAILDEFEQAKLEIAQRQPSIPLWVEKIKSYPPGLLQTCKNTIEMSKRKVSEWLSAYMFKNDPDKDNKASQISGWLANANEHKTHGRPLMFKILQDKGLTISLLEDDQNLQEKVLSVFHAISVTFEVTNCMKFVENHDGKGSFLNAEIKPVN